MTEEKLKKGEELLRAITDLEKARDSWADSKDVLSITLHTGNLKKEVSGSYIDFERVKQEALERLTNRLLDLNYQFKSL